MSKIGKAKDKIVNGGGIFTYMRSVMTSQLSAWTDFIVSFLCFAVLSLSSGISAMIGAIMGGIVNCTVNYKFTFKCSEGSYASIAVKFFLVWVGSLLLNTFGTQYLNAIIQDSTLFDYFGASVDLRFAIARVTASIVVSVFWNFLLQQYFVFRVNRVDSYIDAIVDYLKPGRNS